MLKLSVLDQSPIRKGGTPAEEYGVEEFVCVTICYEHKDRLRSYELLAQAFELERRQAA